MKITRHWSVNFSHNRLNMSKAEMQQTEKRVLGRVKYDLQKD